MKKICKYLLSEIQFVDNRIVPCGSRFWDSYNSADKYFIKPDENQKDVDFDLYFKRREEYIKMYKNGIEPEFCKDCCIYEPENAKQDEDVANFTFDKVHINHKTICSCRCIYCCLADNGDLERFKIINQQKTYDIKPILKQIAEKKLINENTCLAIFGGECTEYPEDLNFIINFGIENNCKFEIASNGIIYNENIERLLKDYRITIRFSLDSGTKETYEKVKRVKAFERVTENIEKYSKVAAKNPEAYLQLKYIICPGVNDNIDELKSFFELAKKYNAKQVILSINRFWLMKNCDKPVKSSVKKFIKYYFNNTEYKDIAKATDPDELWPWWCEKVLKENYFISVIKSMLNIKEG